MNIIDVYLERTRVSGGERDLRDYSIEGDCFTA